MMRLALRLAVVAGIVALVLSFVDLAEVGTVLARAEPGWAALGLVLLLVQTVLSALRWRLTAGRLGLSLSPARAVREYFLSQSLNLSLPGGVLGDAGRALRSRDAAGLLAAGQAVVLERLSGQMALVAVTCAGTMAVALLPGGITLPDGMVLLVLATGAGFFAVLGAMMAGALRLPRLAPWAKAARIALFARPVLPLQLLLSLAGVAANLLAFAACAAAVGVWLSPGAVLVLLPLILFTMLIPLGVGGWGFREGAAGALFPLAGASAAEGFAASATFGGVFLLSSLAGLLLFLWPERKGPEGSTAPAQAYQADAPPRSLPPGG
jgi:uncharacterized membrane protein YbhN (UPF0104 family)